MVMKVLRKRMRIVIWIAAIAFISLIFLAWGMDVTRRTPGGMLQRGIVAKVNGKIIRTTTYREALRDALINARNETGDYADPLTSALIEERVFEQIVQEHLLHEEIAKRGLWSSNAEVLSFMKNVPPEQLRSDSSLITDGEFDFEKYRALFRNPANLPWLLEYERFVRQALPKQKLILTIQSAARLTNLEVTDAFTQQQAKVKLRYILVTPERGGKDIELTDDEVFQYYERNAESFRMPMTVKLSFAHFPTSPSPSDSAEAKQDIHEIYDELRAGAKFNDLASQVSQDRLTAENGGLVGWIKKGETTKTFEDVAFSTRAGRISRPFLSDFGWHIIKVESKRANSVNVRHILVRVAASEVTIESAREAGLLFKEDATSMDFEAAAASHGLTIQETVLSSSRTIFVPGIGYSRVIRDFAFSAKPGALSRVVPTGTGFFVVRLEERKESHIPDFEAVADTIRLLARNEKQMLLAETLADSAGVLLGKGKSMKLTARKLNLEYGVTREFSPATAYLDYPFELLGASALLKDDQTSRPIKTEKGYYIIEVLKRIPPDKDEFAQVSSALSGELLQSKQRRILSEWMADLREKAEVIDYRGQTY
ncbi:hypothetical protein E3J62_01470 [candidate division TA06 bacterium]|uniref:PpiC domain-containing protein n=1 Tax=candidate division TA06 bacterium TaxID=2250710 RepID=A0A523UYL7_UNCT6|nr:MAG: hypothetical protein E3J62_01470 [candidate division TA06 bacterium]